MADASRKCQGQEDNFKSLEIVLCVFLMYEFI